MLDEVFLSCLSRYPRENEKAAMLKLLAEAGAEDRRLIWEDIIWGMFSSREFLFNH